MAGPALFNASKEGYGVTPYVHTGDSEFSGYVGFVILDLGLDAGPPDCACQP